MYIYLGGIIMKKKVLAVLLAVCMIVSTCVLFASAASFAVNSYVEKINDSGSLTADNLRAVSSSTFNIEVTVTEKDSVSLNTGTSKVSADNVDSIFTFKNGSTTLTFAKNLKDYYEVKGTITGNDISVTFTDKDANNLEIYRVDTAIADGETDVSAKLSPYSPAVKYKLSDYSKKATVDDWVSKLCSLTMGVRFFGKTYDNLVASEIAVVTASVERKSGAAASTVTSSVTNKIEDLMIGDKVTLTASLKNADEKDYYAFNCWVDGSGNVVGTDAKKEVTIDGNSVTYYATFVELKNRFTISYSATGNGKLVYAEGREVFSGDAQISVMEGRDATFTFVPDEGYEVAHVYIDKGTAYEKDVASFMYLVDSTDLLASLKELIAATDKDNYTYKFANVTGNHTIEVVYQKVKVLEEPSGKDLPTVPAEGITLATGADDANGGSANGDATTVPAENGAAANGGSAASGVVNPATGSTGAIAVFATLSVAACAAFVTAKKKED